MRYIHNVNFHETFIASGAYHLKNGAIENWTMHRLPDGSHFIRVDIDEREIESGASILVEALQNTESIIERFDVHVFYSKAVDGVMSLRATYTLLEDYVQIGRSFNDQPREYNEVEIAENVYLTPPGSVFIGNSILHSTAHSSDMLRFEACLKHHPIVTVQPFYAELLEEIPLEAAAYQTDTRCFDTTLGRIWIDDHHIPLKIQRDKHKPIVLTRYAHGK